MDYFEYLARKYSAIKRQQESPPIVGNLNKINEYFDYACDPLDLDLLEGGNENHKFFVKNEKKAKE